MGRMAVAPSLMVCLGRLGCVSEKKNPLEGSWRIAAGHQKTPDTAFSYSDGNPFTIKMFADGHVGWFGRWAVGGGDAMAYYG